MVQVRVIGIAVDPGAQPLILLKPLTDEAGGGRMLPIWIGPQEATSIFIAIEGAEAPRPLAHDLMKSLLEALDARVERVDVTRIEEGTFYAEITLQTPTGTRVLDSRPSDAIALAARVDAPIWVADDVLEDAGIPDEAVEGRDREAADAEAAAEEAKLDEFKRFLDEVDPEDFQG
ncbi:bifunctional nuclease family protein [Planctomonas deserti]|uniref:bifunctional nuclease family protein n=1 Tax=Planctomonas deserti TaxID=2144185 RepID=UPI000D39216F|nr:bifunctional nuclease family protein [Planctomonas deserti]